MTGAVFDEVDPNILASSESGRTPAVALSNGSTSNQASASPEDDGDGALGATESSSNLHQKGSSGSSNKKGKVWMMYPKCYDHIHAFIIFMYGYHSMCLYKPFILARLTIC